MIPMARAAHLLLASLLAAPLLAAADAPYTDHAGAWWFTLPATGEPLPGIHSILLKLADGTGFTAFIEPVFHDPLPAQRPPTMAIACYDDGHGDVFVRGQETGLAGACALTVEPVQRELRYVVRFREYQLPLEGYGSYDIDPIGG
jgi:hypothetical protein